MYTLNSLLAAVLIYAGLAKIVSPDPLALALREVIPGAHSLLNARSVRLMSVAEVVLGAGVLLPGVSAPSAVGVGLLATAFLLLGLWGRFKGGTTSCGCIGIRSRAPLGATNVAVGAGLLLVAYLAPPVVSSAQSATAFAGAAVLILLVILAENGPDALKVLKYFTRPAATGGV